MILNEKQKEAVDAIVNGDGNLFVTGVGGSGKSVVAAEGIGVLRTCGLNVMLCAPTGVAARNIGGVTIHSGFRFDLAPKVADRLLNVAVSDAVHAADIIIIDEVGMVRRDLMDAIVAVVEKENLHRRLLGMRELRIVVLGDFAQLPPVVMADDRDVLASEYGEESRYSGFHAFSSDGWDRLEFSNIILDQVMRQTDSEFVGQLDLARVGDPSCIPYFNQFVGAAPHNAVHIVGTNREALRINEAMLGELSSRPRTYKGKVKGAFKETDMPAPQILTLAVGARVILVANDSEGRYVNGSTGTIDWLGADTVGVKLDDGPTIEVEAKIWENITYEVVTEKDGERRLEENVIGSYSQLPMKLAWALTFHKAQGQTIDRVHVYPPTFAAGQLYVGLSRARNPGGLTLSVPIKPEWLKADGEVVEFYHNLG